MTSNFKILHYNSWNELKRDISNDICSDDFFPYHNYIFRGQSNEEWGLVASFDRSYGGLPFEERQKMEKLLIEGFRDLCIGWDGKDKFKNYSLLQLMSVGQHYGLPTRLLDWSYSLYIAAFFAFSDIEEVAPSAAIWVLDMNHESWNAGYGVSIETARIDENDRQKYQYGVFTLNKSPEKSIEDYLSICAKNHSVDGSLYKIIIPVKEKKVILGDLDMMGINHFNIYRGMEGCAKSAVLRAFLK